MVSATQIPGQATFLESSPIQRAFPKMPVALVLAIVLHAAILSLPVVREKLSQLPAVTPIVVELIPKAIEEPKRPEPIREFVERPPVAPTIELPTRPQPAAPVTSVVTQPANPDPEAFRWQPDDEPQQTTRQLGVYEPVPLPDNWTRPLLPLEPNLFDEAVLPRETEIVDRWVESDGTHNVVVSTPTGDTLCGRQSAFNPMQSLVEPLMMWRKCAGGGKRKLNFERSSFNNR